MKIQPEHYEHMKREMAARAHLILQIRDQIAVDPRVRDAEKRLRWDLFHVSGLTRYVCDHVYNYANDVHIDTALRSIMREISPLPQAHVAAEAPEGAPEEEAPRGFGMR